MERLRLRVSDRRVLKLLRSWLRAGVLEGQTLRHPETGTPQGGVISPLLANVYLDALDWAWQADRGKLEVLVRYADDLVICCATKARAEASLAELRALLGELGLELAEEKVRIVYMAAQSQDKFEFLGFEHRMVRSRKSKDGWYLARWPSERAMRGARARIKELTRRARLDVPQTEVIRDLNRFLTGWGGYFRHGHSTEHFRKIDSYAIDRLGRFIGIRHKKRRTLHQGRAMLMRQQKLGLRPLVGTVGKARAHAVR